jgi:uroporphyrinogen-III synthase
MSVVDAPEATVGVGFDGCRVLALESRRAEDLRRLITTNGGVPLVVPAIREVPRESAIEALRFADALARGELTDVVFLTGVGTRAIGRAIEAVLPRDRLAAALNRVSVVARGPKPVAELRQMGVNRIRTAPLPHTWREVLGLFDAAGTELPLRNRHVAVQEYGESNELLLQGLRRRGARVMSVPVYAWALPEDAEPLRSAVTAVARGEFDVMLFTTSAQVRHIVHVAAELGLDTAFRRACEHALIVSIGPTTSEELRRHGVTPDFEPTRPNMGLLVVEAAGRGIGLLKRKRHKPA